MKLGDLNNEMESGFFCRNVQELKLNRAAISRSEKVDLSASLISWIEVSLKGGVKWICVAFFSMRSFNAFFVSEMTAFPGMLNVVCVYV